MKVVVLTDFSYANILNYCPFVNRDIAFSLSGGHFFDFTLDIIQKRYTIHFEGVPFDIFLVAV